MRNDFPSGHEACVGANPDIFFPPFESALVDGGKENPAPVAIHPGRIPTYNDSEAKRIAKAKSICDGCPSQPPCLEYAIRHNVEGIWGGTTDDERRTIVRAREIERSRQLHPSQVARVGGIVLRFRRRNS